MFRSANCLDSSTTCSKRTFSLSGPLLNTTVGQLTLFNSMINVKDQNSCSNIPGRPLSAPGVYSLNDLNAVNRPSTISDSQLQVPILPESKISVSSTPLLPSVDEQLLPTVETPTASPNSEISSNVEWL